MFELCGPLAVRTGQSEQVVGQGTVTIRCVGRGFIDEKLTVDVEIEQLVKALPAKVSAELERMRSNYFTDAVTPLKRVTDLRQFTLAIVSYIECAAHLNKRQPRVVRGQKWVYARGIALLLVIKAKGHPDRKRSKPRRWCGTGILHSAREYRVLEGSLRFAIVIKSDFVDGGVAEGPGVGNIPLLKPLVSN